MFLISFFAAFSSAFTLRRKLSALLYGTSAFFLTLLFLRRPEAVQARGFLPRGAPAFPAAAFSLPRPAALYCRINPGKALESVSLKWHRSIIILSYADGLKREW